MSRSNFVTIEFCGKERDVEVLNGPRKLFANSGVEYYEGFVLPEPCDPYGEPYKIFFSADKIIRAEVHTLDTLQEPLMTCRKVLAPGLEVFCLRGGCAADDGPEVEVMKAIRASHYPLDLAAERLRLY